MNLGQLEAFVVTCELGSYTRAAAQLCISQPALHHKVRLLESELGSRVLRVQNRRVVPSSDGLVLLQTAREILHKVAEIESYFRDARSSTDVRILCLSLIATQAMTDLLNVRESSLADITLKAVTSQPDGIYESLVEHSADFAITWEEATPRDLAIEPHSSAEIICVARPDHPLLSDAPVPVRAVVDYPIALAVKGTGLRDAVDTWFRQYCSEQELPVVFEAPGGSQAVQMVIRSKGFLTFVPRQLMVELPLVELRTLSDPLILRSVICYLPGNELRENVRRVISTLHRLARERRYPPIRDDLLIEYQTKHDDAAGQQQ